MSETFRLDMDGPCSLIQAMMVYISRVTSTVSAG
jgi:hypothetical protein